MNSKRSKQFATTGCQTVEDLIEHIRQLPGTGLSQFDIEDISMRTSTGRTLSLESSLKHLLDDEDFENSQDEPLRLKSTKHIEIVEVDSCGRPVGELKKIALSSNQALVQLMSSMPTFILAPFDEQQTLIAEFSAIEDGKRYVWRSMHEKAIANMERWRNNEAKAMENEVTLCIVSFLQSRGQQKISVYNGEISTFQHRVLQEWDGIVYSGEESKLYLAQAKHNMRIEDLETKVDHFSADCLQSSSILKEIHDSEIQLVACGTLFTPQVRKAALERGFLVCIPSGSRYTVQNKP